MASEPPPASPQSPQDPHLESPTPAATTPTTTHVDHSDQNVSPIGQPDTSTTTRQVAPQNASAPAAPQAPRAPRPRVNGLPVWSLLAWQWLRANTFVPPWLPARWRHPATGYFLAAALQVLAAVITCLLIGFVSTYLFPGLLELLVVMFIALTWGAGPSLFATLLGVALEEIVVLTILVGDVGVTGGSVVEVTLFLVIGIGISLVASASEQSRRRAQAQERELAAMRQLQERMDAFLAIASHDLRTPVMTTRGYIDIAARRSDRLAAAARETPEEKADLVRHLEGIRRQIEGIQACMRDACHSGERLAGLVNLLFDTSLARAGELKLQPTVCDLAALVRELVEGQRMSTLDRIIHLQLPPAEPVWVLADAVRIGQVVTNYLTNALKYSPSEGVVDVRLTVGGGWARVAVEDRGSGLPPGELERVWQRFYRVAQAGQVSDASAHSGADSSSTGSASGLGVGLHISKTIVELHGGTVGVESVVGHGSTFWFALPLDVPSTHERIADVPTA